MGHRPGRRTRSRSTSVALHRHGGRQVVEATLVPVSLFHGAMTLWRQCPAPPAVCSVADVGEDRVVHLSGLDQMDGVADLAEVAAWCVRHQHDLPVGVQRTGIRRHGLTEAPLIGRLDYRRGSGTDAREYTGEPVATATRTTSFRDSRVIGLDVSPTPGVWTGKPKSSSIRRRSRQVGGTDGMRALARMSDRYAWCTETSARNIWTSMANSSWCWNRNPWAASG